MLVYEKMPYRSRYQIFLAQEMLEPLKWRYELPFFSLPDGMEIKVVPNYGGSTARFIVRNKITKKEVSVYLDCYNTLGYGPDPYWEMYPNKDDTTQRFDMKDMDGLMETIKDTLK